MTALAPTLQAFFTERLARQKNASPHTVAAYRDALRMLVQFAARRIGTAPARLQIEDVDAQLVGAFLDHLEHDRGNSARSRNTRLAAIHSLFGFAALRHPEHAALIARVLAIPPKRCDRAVVSFLTDEEIDALLTAPNTSRWLGRRDHTLLLVAVQTGLRVSELTALCCDDVHLGHGAHVRCWVLSRVRDNTHRTTERLRTSRSIRSSATSARKRFNSSTSPVERPRVPSCSARSLATQLPRVPALTPRSRATWAIGLPVSRTMRTAPSRNSGSNFLRVSGIPTPHSACLHGFGGDPFAPPASSPEVPTR